MKKNNNKNYVIFTDVEFDDGMSGIDFFYIQGTSRIFPVGRVSFKMARAIADFLQANGFVKSTYISYVGDKKSVIRYENTFD
jgi:hypothetical protein